MLPSVEFKDQPVPILLQFLTQKVEYRALPGPPRAREMDGICLLLLGKGTNTSGQVTCKGCPAKLILCDLAQRIVGLDGHTVRRLAQCAAPVRQKGVQWFFEFTLQSGEEVLLLQLQLQIRFQVAQTENNQPAVQFRCRTPVEEGTDVCEPDLNWAFLFGTTLVQSHRGRFLIGILRVPLQNGFGEGCRGDRLTLLPLTACLPDGGGGNLAE